jgi:RNA polymerase sigma-70 factor, ECF subfamily
MTDVTATPPDLADLDTTLEQHRKELTAYCYRMLGSGFEAEDAVQETFVRAWRSIDRFEGRSSLRSWLYRIATNVCTDMHRAPQRRARAVDMGPAHRAEASTFPQPTAAEGWLEPVADSRVLADTGDPAEVAAQRDSIRLAFVAALQHLPARQRAVLILCEVLRWQASEVADLLESSVASVNSALQRARATLDSLDMDQAPTAPAVGDQQVLLDAFIDAFERYDVHRLVKLLRDDVRFSMPPFPMWLQGPEQVATWLEGHGIGCKGGRVLPAGWANGYPAVASYRRTEPDAWTPWALHVLELDADGRIAAWTNFLETDLFPAFGLPTRIDAATSAGLSED